MLKKIFITAIPNPRNLGSMAVILSAKQLLEKSFPQAKLIFLSTYYLNPENRRFYEKYEIEPVDYLIFKQSSSKFRTIAGSSIYTFQRFFDSVSHRFCKIFSIKSKSIYNDCDVIVDLSTESINDLYGLGIPLFTLLNLSFFLIAGKKVVLFASSAGPIKNKYLSAMVRYVLNHVDMITVREGISKEFLQRLGVHRPTIHVTADLAFLLNPVSDDKVNEILTIEHVDRTAGLIGVAPSQLIHRYAFPDTKDRATKYKKYVELMANLIDYTIDKTGRAVILIPHVIMPTPDDSQDDRIVIKEIFQAVKNKAKVTPLTGEYMPDELKGIMGICDMFIGCRMHSVIGATSMTVPTLAISYGTKFQGVVGQMMSQEQWVVKIENTSAEELLSTLKQKVNFMWENRDSIRASLASRLIEIKELSAQNGVLLEEFLDSTLKADM